MILSQREKLQKDKLIHSITFKVEDLSEPDNLLEEKPLEEILNKFSSKIEEHSKTQSPLVSNGFHSFLYGMYQAYAEHRPFTLSPDMIWLLICQGFSRHVSFSKAKGNNLFPSLKTKQALIVTSNTIKLGDSSSSWGESTAQFIEAIKEKMGDELISVLSADFSTTGINERIASQVTIMDTMKPYFEYILAVFICGIPEITLEGTTADWEKILQKLRQIRKYDLDWWVDKLEGIIEEFIQASKGEINQAFWMNMFKVHTLDEYGHPEFIDGWITNFYPYDRKGNLTDFNKMKDLGIESICENLPKEIVCVDFLYRELDDFGNIVREVPLEYWAGFVGLVQNQINYNLRPEIGWFVAHQEKSIRNESSHGHSSNSRVYHDLVAFPRELLKNQKWDMLVLNFKDEIDIPWSILKLNIHMLELNGKIRTKDKLKLRCLKQKFRMSVNGVEV